MQAAAPVSASERHAFLAELADELQHYQTIGPGLVHRLAAMLQKRHVVEARSMASSSAELRHQEHARRRLVRPAHDG
jgi:hypothetical protein